MGNIFSNVRLSSFCIFITLVSIYTQPTLGQQGPEAALSDTAMTYARTWTAAWNNLNAENMIKLHSKDLQYYYGGKRMAPRATFERVLQEDIIPNETYSIKMVDPHVQVMGSGAAVVSFLLRGETTRKEATSPFAAAVSLVLEKRNGKWKIIHIHESSEGNDTGEQH